MADERPVTRIDGDEDTHVHATWGRSGKRAIVTVGGRTTAQVVLTPEQAAQLGRFLIAGPDAAE